MPISATWLWWLESRKIKKKILERRYGSTVFIKNNHFKIPGKSLGHPTRLKKMIQLNWLFNV